MANVFFLPARADEGPYDLGQKVLKVYARLGFEVRVPVGAMVAVKVHVGEPGRPAPIAPVWLRPVIERLTKKGAQPFLTDTCTLYRGGRSNGVVHLRTAADRGFNLENAGAPFLVADGLLGESHHEVAIPGQHFDSVAVAGAAARATALLVVSHFTGHMGTSFGAAVKNLGMGLAARSGKLQQHAVAKPTIDTPMCAGCGVCMDICAAGAIRFEDNHAVIDHELCTGCGQCITACFMEGIQADYGANTQLLQERVAEHALGVVQGKEETCAYLTFLMRITRNCDCIGNSEPPLCPDIGLLASSDPVAIDQAACDLIVERTGQSIAELCQRDLDPTWQLKHAEALGLGSRGYDLISLSEAF